MADTSGLYQVFSACAKAHANCTGTAPMAASTLPENVKYSISQTHKGWLLVIENPHCSLSQVFQSSASAREALDRTAFALQTLTAQHLEMRLAAEAARL